MKQVGIKQTGFTIVELIIVIVIIGILASLTVVAYQGVTNRGYNARVTTGVVSYIKAVQVYKIRNGAYPTQTGCLGANYPSGTCWSGVDGTFTVNSSLDTALATVMDSKPMLADKLFSIGVNNNTRAGALYFSSGGAGPFKVIYYLNGAGQTCPQGIGGTEGGVVTQCIFTFS